jgi:hypothetical protein
MTCRRKQAAAAAGETKQENRKSDNGLGRWLKVDAEESFDVGFAFAFVFECQKVPTYGVPTQFSLVLIKLYSAD